MTGSMSDSDRDDDHEMHNDGERMPAHARGSVIAQSSSARHGRGHDGDPHIAGLVRTIEGEIIPRLMLAHATAGRAALPPDDADAPRIGAEHIEAMVNASIGTDAGAAFDYARTLLGQGVRLETVYLELLTPAARELGRRWEEDACTFTDVTIALWRLQEAMHELGLTVGSPLRGAEQPHRVLLRKTPGDQHSFGINMVSEMFRRAGWDVRDESSEAGTDPVSNVRNDWFDVAGLSLAGERHLDTLATTIRAMRKASRNRALGVMVGGPVFIEHPDWVARVGADATAADARMAVLQAHNMIGLLARAG